MHDASASLVYAKLLKSGTYAAMRQALPRVSAGFVRASARPGERRPVQPRHGQLPGRRAARKFPRPPGCLRLCGGPGHPLPNQRGKRLGEHWGGPASLLLHCFAWSCFSGRMAAKPVVPGRWPSCPAFLEQRLLCSGHKHTCMCTSCAHLAKVLVCQEPLCLHCIHLRGASGAAWRAARW